MHAIQQAFRENRWLFMLATTMAGLALYYLYALVHFSLMPVSLHVARVFIDPSSRWAWGALTALNFAYVTTAGAVSSVVVLLLLNYVLAPTRMAVFYISMCIFWIMANWWFLTDVPTRVQNEEPEYLLLKLLAPICVLGVFSLGGWWLVRKNAANPAVYRTCAKNRAGR